MDFVPANPGINEGRLYSTLSKLEKENLIERKVHIQTSLPNQKITHITSQGLEEFLSWLASNEDEEDDTKFDFFKQYSFLSKVNYYRHFSNEKAVAKFTNQLEISNQRLQRFCEAREKMLSKGVDWYRIKIIEYGIHVEKVKIEWLKEVLADLKKKEAD